jgi:GNAT superfamily N-acetyltransferase
LRTLNRSSALRGYQGWKADGEAVVTLWNDSLGEQFPMDLRLWRQNVDDDPHYDVGGLFLAGSEGEPLRGHVFARVARVPMGGQPINAKRGWINSLMVAPSARRTGLGTQLLTAAQAWLRQRGVEEILLGGDPGHFFPGLPVHSTDAIAFFEARGYQRHGDPGYDVMRDISDFEMPETVGRVLARNVAFRFSECTSRNVPALFEFLQKTFPGRWLYETQMRVEAERSPQDIQILSIGSRVVGFAHTFHSGSQRLGPSVYWRGLLKPAWGGLGPIGVAEDVRKSGLGFALLCKSIERLRGLGVHKMAIDWTTLLKFYGAAGLEYGFWKRSV